jgi:hypothetical protein
MTKEKRSKKFLANQWLCYSFILLAGISIIGFVFFNTLTAVGYWGDTYFTNHINWAMMATNQNILIAVSFVFILIATMFNFMAIIYENKQYIFATISSLILYGFCAISLEKVIVVAILVVLLCLGYKIQKNKV